MSNMELKNKITPLAIKYGIDKITLFGSMARGDYNENSDYDFLISKGQLKSLIQYMAFVDELENVLNSHVDVITDTSSDETIISIASNEGVIIYEK